MKTQIIIHPEELSAKWIYRAKAAGIDRIGIHPRGGRDAVSSLENLLSLLKNDEYRALIDDAYALGFEIEYELHAAGYLLPRELFDEHPEYFRVNKDGVRTPDWNFCVSDSDALSLVAKNAAQLADSLYGSREHFYFWMDDARDSKCHCEKCKELSESDAQLTVVNAMISAIRKKHKNAKMAYLAYQDTIPLPEKALPVNGVFLEYAPFEKYTAKGENRDMLIARERDMIQPLIDFFGKTDLKLLEYWYDNSLFSHWKKPPVKFTADISTMTADMVEYSRFPFDTVSTFACFLGEDYEALYGAPDITDFNDILRRTKMVEVKKDGVYLDGEKFFLISGDFHYFRTLPGGWKRRLELMRDFGLTALSTYVPWNLHEAKKGQFNFEGNADIVRFLKEADEVGLKVILRLSPYMCGEWEMGGLPAWLLTDRTMGLRTSDPKFMKHLREYTEVLIDKVRPFLYTNGGPVIFIGLENEYGSYGNDKEYLKQLSVLYRELGIDVPFISANGSDPFKFHNGTLKDNWNGIDLGASPRSLGELDVLAGHQPDKPLFISEAWVGNIQFWGKSFKVNRGAERNAEFLKAALERNTVVNFYMFCGGTNFGFYNGALAVDAERKYTPLMTSYDYDAPISEEGLLRDKYFAMRDVLDDCLSKPRRPHVQPGYESQSIKDVRYTAYAPFLDNTKRLADKTLECARPICMEDAGQNYGFMRYTTRIGYTDDRERTLHIDGVNDRAYIYLDGVFAGVYMRDCNNKPVKFCVPKDGIELSILLENTGRINYGYKVYDRKGIDTVRVDIQNPDGTYLYNFASNTNFTVETLPLESLAALEYSDRLPENDLPVFCRAEFEARAGVDTFIDMRGHNKGAVFVNGFNLGRFWHIGPQQTLYVPGELIKDNNTLEILELQFDKNKTSVDFIESPILTEIEKEDHSTDGFELK